MTAPPHERTQETSSWVGGWLLLLLLKGREASSLLPLLLAALLLACTARGGCHDRPPHKFDALLKVAFLPRGLEQIREGSTQAISRH